jgi:hypothetical protein
MCGGGGGMPGYIMGCGAIIGGIGYPAPGGSGMGIPMGGMPYDAGGINGGMVRGAGGVVTTVGALALVDCSKAIKAWAEATLGTGVEDAEPAVAVAACTDDADEEDDGTPGGLATAPS